MNFDASLLLRAGRAGRAGLGCALLAALAPSASAGDLDLRRVPAETRLLVHVDVEAVLGSTLWSLVQEQRDVLDLDLTELRHLEAEIGLDPLRDVRSVTVFGSGTDLDHAVVAVTVSERVEQALARLQAESGYRSLHDRGYELHTWRDEEAFAWIDRPSADDPHGDRVVVISERMADVVHAAEVARGRAPSLASARGSALLARPSPGAFVHVAVTGELPGLVDAEEASAVFDLARDLSLEVGEARELLFARLTVTTEAEQDARDVLDILQGAKAIAQLALRSQEEVPPEIHSLLSAVTVDRRGNSVLVDFEYPVRELAAHVRALSAGERYR